MNTEIGLKLRHQLVLDESGAMHASDLKDKGYVVKVSYPMSKLLLVENVTDLVRSGSNLTEKVIKNAPK